MGYEDAVYFAKTWGLVYMVAIFAVAVFYALRPGAKKKFDDAAGIPLKED